MTRPPTPRAGQRHVEAAHSGYLPWLNWEPVSGFEPLACRLQEVCSQATHALAAPMAQGIALTAPAALGLCNASSHEPFHANGGQQPMAITQRSDNSPQQLEDMIRQNGRRICRAPVHRVPAHATDRISSRSERCQNELFFDQDGAAARPGASAPELSVARPPGVRAVPPIQHVVS